VVSLPPVRFPPQTLRYNVTNLFFPALRNADRLDAALESFEKALKADPALSISLRGKADTLAALDRPVRLPLVSPKSASC
jgi:hypothetical protein